MQSMGAFFFRGYTYYVRLGANRLDITEYGYVDVTARNSIVYGGYSPTTLRNDIALIQLPYSVSFSCECSSYQTLINIVNTAKHFLLL
jgi:hypothetical protein